MAAGLSPQSASLFCLSRCPGIRCVRPGPAGGVRRVLMWS